MSGSENQAPAEENSRHPAREQPSNRAEEYALELLADPKYSLQQIREKMSPTFSSATKSQALTQLSENERPRIIKTSYEAGQEQDPLEEARQCINDKKHGTAQAILTDVLKQETGSTATKAKCLYLLGLNCEANQDNKAARSWYEQAMKVSDKVFGKNSLASGINHRNIARTYINENNWQEAERSNDRAFSIFSQAANTSAEKHKENPTKNPLLWENRHFIQDVLQVLEQSAEIHEHPNSNSPKTETQRKQIAENHRQNAKRIRAMLQEEKSDRSSISA